HLDAVCRVATDFPALQVVIDHAAKPDLSAPVDPAWHRGLAAAARLDNVSVKLSGLLTEAPPGADATALQPHVDVLLDCFGPRRMIWGSDWPVLDLASDYGSWDRMTTQLLAGLGGADIAAILGDNAARVYGLEP
ncbi:MAG: hypothetical protein RLZZ200_1516, partial [Pseudomonadota bacterium]